MALSAAGGHMPGRIIAVRFRNPAAFHIALLPAEIPSIFRHVQQHINLSAHPGRLYILGPSGAKRLIFINFLAPAGRANSPRWLKFSVLSEGGRA